jgi:hypothetical protein
MEQAGRAVILLSGLARRARLVGGLVFCALLLADNGPEGAAVHRRRRQARDRHLDDERKNGQQNPSLKTGRKRSHESPGESLSHCVIVKSGAQDANMSQERI